MEDAVKVAADSENYRGVFRKLFVEPQWAAIVEWLEAAMSGSNAVLDFEDAFRQLHEGIASEEDRQGFEHNLVAMLSNFAGGEVPKEVVDSIKKVVNAMVELMKGAPCKVEAILMGLCEMGVSLHSADKPDSSEVDRKFNEAASQLGPITRRAMFNWGQITSQLGKELVSAVRNHDVIGPVVMDLVKLYTESSAVISVLDHLKGIISMLKSGSPRKKSHFQSKLHHRS